MQCRGSTAPCCRAVEGSARIDETKARAIGGGQVVAAAWRASSGRDAVVRLRPGRPSRTPSLDRRGGLGLDSDKGLDAFAAAVRDPKTEATDWFKAGDTREEMARVMSTMS
jgi:hypothetical protein